VGNNSQNGQNPDKVFMANFSKVMAGLGAIFAICLIAASFVAGVEIRDSEGLEALKAERLAPIGRVATDSSQLTVAVADTQREPLSGAEVNERVCAGCHAAGVLGAPKTGDNVAWSERFAQGLDTLVEHSINGIRQMPARGGDSSLSDDEVRDAVVHLLEAADIEI
jgi:cytochrome c5